MWTGRQKMAVADWGFAGEAEFSQFVPGKILSGNVFDSVNNDGSSAAESEFDADSFYLVRRTLAFVWPYACSSSAGREAITTITRAMIDVTRLTNDSSASDRIATDPVRRYPPPLSRIVAAAVATASAAYRVGEACFNRLLAGPVASANNPGRRRAAQSASVVNGPPAAASTGPRTPKLERSPTSICGPNDRRFP